MWSQLDPTGGYTFSKRRGGAKALPPILVCPPRGNGSFHATLYGWIGHVYRALAEHGFPILSGKMGGTTTHGNAASATAVGTAKTAAVSTYGLLNVPVGILATSMGSLAALRYYMDNPSNVVCACFGVPNLDLRDVHDVTRTDLAAEIDAAHGGAGGFSTYLTNYNPADHTANLVGLPQLVYYATNDPNFTSTVAPAYVAATGAEGHSLGAVGHDPSTIPAASVVDFFTQHLV